MAECQIAGKNKTGRALRFAGSKVQPPIFVIWKKAVSY